ncbi:MAG: tetratricopeptide repeat protein [Bdellovibrionota bacterium]
MKSIKFIALSFGLLLTVSASAQHPVEIQQQTADGDHFRALVDFEKLPKRRQTIESRLAAAKSAWALGLVERAAAEYDLLLREEGLEDHEKAKVLLSRGIIELQEGNFDIASVYAEKAIKKLDKSSPLRSRAWMLWGQGLFDSKSYGSACQKFKKALDEALPAEKPEVEYNIGKCERRLGKNDNALEHFQKIPLHHEKTPSAVRNLAHLSLESGQYEQAAFWLAKGRQEYPDYFLDSWVDYALMKVAIHERDSEKVVSIKQTAVAKYPPSDGWLALINAASEAYHWAEEAEEEQGEQDVN